MINHKTVKQEEEYELKATKCIAQKISPNQDLDYAMIVFKEMMNHSIRIGIKHNATTVNFPFWRIMNIAREGWARFTHPGGDTDEAESGTFEPAMTESTSYD